LIAATTSSRFVDSAVTVFVVAVEPDPTEIVIDGFDDDVSGQDVIVPVTDTWLAASWSTVNDTLPAVAVEDAVALAADDVLDAVKELRAFVPRAAFAVVATAAIALLRDCSAVVCVCSVDSWVFSCVCGADSIAISFVMMPLVSSPLESPVRPSPERDVVLRVVDDAIAQSFPCPPGCGDSRYGSGMPASVPAVSYRVS
jgi:hypothetical protein